MDARAQQHHKYIRLFFMDINVLKLKTSQMGFADLRALKEEGLEQYDRWISQEPVVEEKISFSEEKAKFHDIMEQIIGNKFTTFLGDED